MTVPLWLASFRDELNSQGHTPRALSLVTDHTVGTQADPDHTLVEGIRASDERAFRRIWDQYHVVLAEFADRYVRSPDTALDVVQHVFFTLWRQRATFHPNGTLASYLYTSVRNRAWNVIKHDRIIQRHADTITHGPEHARNLGEVSLETDELLAIVTQILATVPPRAREVFLMHREDGLAPAQIASILHVAPQTVYNHLARVTKALAEGVERWRRPQGT